MKEGTIICGFAGIGKTTMAKNNQNIVDLESTPFEKDWDRYIRVANHMKRQGYDVLVSCHKELRKELLDRKIDYVVVMPNKNKKSDFMERYKRRGNTQEFIKLLDSNWNSFNETLKGEKVYRLNGYLEDEYNNIVGGVEWQI